MHLETVVGTAPETLIELSRGAALLVVGADAPDAEIRLGLPITASSTVSGTFWWYLSRSSRRSDTRSAVELVKDDLVEQRRDRVQSLAQGQDRLNAAS